MSLHRVTLRKDGPVHAVEYKKGYGRSTLCGLPLSGLERPKRRIFEPDIIRHPCGRCAISFRKRA